MIEMLYPALEDATAAKSLGPYAGADHAATRRGRARLRTRISYTWAIAPQLRRTQSALTVFPPFLVELSPVSTQIPISQVFHEKDFGDRQGPLFEHSAL